MQGGPAAAVQSAYEPPAESALLADGLIEPVRAFSESVFLSEHQAVCTRLLWKWVLNCLHAALRCLKFISSYIPVQSWSLAIACLAEGSTAKEGSSEKWLVSSTRGQRRSLAHDSDNISSSEFGAGGAWTGMQTLKQNLR